MAVKSPVCDFSMLTIGSSIKICGFNINKRLAFKYNSEDLFRFIFERTFLNSTVKFMEWSDSVSSYAATFFPNGLQNIPIFVKIFSLYNFIFYRWIFFGDLSVFSFTVL